MTQPVIRVVVKLASASTFGVVGKGLTIAQSSEKDEKLISGNLQPAESVWRLFTILPQP